MKKKLIIIGAILLVIVVTVTAVLFLNRTTYRIEVGIVDERSPDRILTVFNNKNEKVEVKRIEYLDGTLLCRGYNTAVHFGDIENEKELKVILKDNKEVKAKIVKEEVKK